jgi:hypothetical protein
MIYTARPTCGHESLTYRTLKLAKAHGQAHANRSGKPVHITKTDQGQLSAVCTMKPTTCGPWMPCETARTESQRYDD